MGCATGVVKAVVFVFNIIFVLAGLGLIILGVLFKLSVQTDVVDTEEFKSLAYAPIFTIVVGSIIFIIAFFGCCGALRSSTCMLTTYAIILLVILVLQVAIGVYAFLQIKDDRSFRDIVINGLKKSFSRYEKDVVVQSFFNETQTTLHCCGVEGPLDYGITIKLPNSCCDAHQTCTQLSAYRTGCGEKLYEILETNIKVVGIVVISIAVTELIGAIVVLCLVSSIRNEERRGVYA